MNDVRMIKIYLKNKDEEFVLSQREADKKHHTLMKFICEASSYAYLTGKLPMYAFLMSRLLSISLDSGISIFSAVGFCFLANRCILNNPI